MPDMANLGLKAKYGRGSSIAGAVVGLVFGTIVFLAAQSKWVCEGFGWMTIMGKAIGESVCLPGYAIADCLALTKTAAWPR